MLERGTCAYHMTKSERGAKNKIGEGVDFKYSKRNATKLISGASSGERSAALYTPRDSHPISFRSQHFTHPRPSAFRFILSFSFSFFGGVGGSPPIFLSSFFDYASSSLCHDFSFLTTTQQWEQGLAVKRKRSFLSTVQKAQIFEC